MLIYPAVDLFDGKAVRLLKGDYDAMTVYGSDPAAFGAAFREAGATCMHIVDLEGAKSGETPNYASVLSIKKKSGLFCEVGGGIRSLDVVSKYLDAGLDRVILGTAAVADPAFVADCVKRYGEKIAVGVDIRDGFVAVKGWTEKSEKTAFDFLSEMTALGVGTFIATDISRDGAMKGTNHTLYAELIKRFPVRIIASGGVSSLDDIKRLRDAGLYGAIVGKAYYEGALSLKEAIEVAK